MLLAGADAEAAAAGAAAVDSANQSDHTMPRAVHSVLKFSSSETASSGTIVSTMDRYRAVRSVKTS